MRTDLSFGMIKPDAMRAGKMGEIITAILEADFEIVALKTIRLSPQLAGSFYEVHKGKPFFDGLVDFMCSGQITVMVLKKENAVLEWRTLMGATDSTKAAPGTLRNRFGTDISFNAVHGADSNENAAREISFYFSEAELINN